MKEEPVVLKEIKNRKVLEMSQSGNLGEFESIQRKLKKDCKYHIMSSYDILNERGDADKRLMPTLFCKCKQISERNVFALHEEMSIW